MARFTLPRDLYHGPHALEALKTLPGKRAMICVGGGSMKRFGFLASLPWLSRMVIRTLGVLPIMNPTGSA